MIRADQPTYQLLIRVSEPVRAEIGRLGVFDFPAGLYAYTGSAKRCPEARIARHFSKLKRLRWHIDYLLAAPGVAVESAFRFSAPECEVNQTTLGRVLVPRFGATDCRSGCLSHLKLLDDGGRDSR